MSTDTRQKVNAGYLRRDAFLYVRQSSLRQSFENTESGKGQYALCDRAVALGWRIERIHTFDTDLGPSASQAEHRDGFQHLVRRAERLRATKLERVRYEAELSRRRYVRSIRTIA